MTKRSSLRFLLVLSATMIAPGTEAAGLSSYRWKNRLLLVTTTPDRHGKTAASLKQNRAGLLDRDLVVIDLSAHDKRLAQAVRPAPDGARPPVKLPRGAVPVQRWVRRDHRRSAPREAAAR